MSFSSGKYIDSQSKLGRVSREELEHPSYGKAEDFLTCRPCPQKLIKFRRPKAAV
jgi:hypothetical protein